MKTVGPIILALGLLLLGLLAMWAWWSLLTDLLAWMFGKYLWAFLALVGLYLVGLEIYERRHLRNRK